MENLTLGSVANRTISASKYLSEASPKIGILKKMHKNLFISIVSSMLFVLPIQNVSAKISPSFDCDKATTEVEKLICSDDELALKKSNIEKCELCTAINCNEGNTQVEELTCSNGELLGLFQEMQTVYFNLCQSLTQQKERSKLCQVHLDWMKKQSSADYMEFSAYNRRVFYLKEAYQERIQNLKNLKVKHMSNSKSIDK